MNKIKLFWIIFFAYCSTLILYMSNGSVFLSPIEKISIVQNGKNNLSKGHEVWLKIYDIGDINLQKNRNLTNNNDVYVLTGNNNNLNIFGKITDRSKIIFYKNQYSGIIELNCNNKISQIDLYDLTSKEHVVELKTFIGFGYKNILFYTFSFFVFLFIFLMIDKFLKLSEIHHASSLNTGYLDRLDHLRFFAAFMVISYHFFHDIVGLSFETNNILVTLIDEGHVGVSLFMVLSGFIFGFIGYGKELSWGGFMRNRILRIYPLYIFAIFIAFSVHRMDYQSEKIIYYFLPFINQVQLTQLPLFGQLWTIGTEFLFYLVFPFLILFVNRYGIKYLVGLILLLLFIREFYYIVDGTVRDIGYWTILGRMDYFLIGIGTAVIYKKYNEKFSSVAYLIFAISFCLFLLHWFNGEGGYAGTYTKNLWVYWPTIEALMWGFLILAYLSSKITLPKTLNSILSTLGTLSFSLYVTHYLVIPIIHRKIGVINIFENHQVFNIIFTSMVAVIPLVMLLSIFTYLLIEKPFMDLRIKYIK